jgi:UDP-N-acetylmuramoylalanine--D-glutamate ligase
MGTAAMNLDASLQPSVLVMGMGATGASVARYLAGRGVGAEFADSRSAPPGTAAILDAIPDARLHTGGRLQEIGPTIRKVVVSPGADIRSAPISAARDRGVEIVSDIDLFVSECRSPIVAVTGSNGKSTVTSMLGLALPTVGYSTAIGGNLGTPALDLLDQASDVYVLELSSFQLERSKPVPSAAAVILNISPDHLDIHDDMQAYTAAKALIYRDCRHAVVNRDEPDCASLVPAETPVTSFGLGEPGAGEFGLRTTARGECLAFGDQLLLSADELSVTGRHDISNALAALALGSALESSASGATRDSIRHGMAQALKAYRGLPHRMQVVMENDGVTWVDDSKATNVAAAVASIASIAGPIVLIAGGESKGGEFEALAAALSGRQCAAILLGQAADEMAGVLAPVCDIECVTDMQSAVAAAIVRAGAGHTVLLAPACSSLDMFESYVQRGKAFADAAREQTQGPPGHCHDSSRPSNQGLIICWSLSSPSCCVRDW